MENIIRMLYNGELCPAEESREVVNQYREIYEKRKGMDKSFYKSLEEGQQKEYEELMEEHFMLSAKELEQAFYKGYQTAVRLILQGLL